MHLPAEPSERLSGGPSLSNRPIIFVVEDDEDIARLISHNLQAAGFDVQSFVSGASVISEALREMPSLFLLDVMLPGMDGFELCRQIRQSSIISGTPIIFLTAKTAEADRVKGLELGGDDYVTKPFSPRELVARVKALLRRTEPGTPSEKPIEIGVLRIDPAAYKVTRGGKAVPMSTLEFRLLYFLAARAHRVFTRDQLLDAVWGTERFVTPRSVDVYVRRLRE